MQCSIIRTKTITQGSKHLSVKGKLILKVETTLNMATESCPDSENYGENTFYNYKMFFNVKEMSMYISVHQQCLKWCLQQVAKYMSRF